MDKQFAFAVVLMILGFGLTQLKQSDDGPFFSGLGVGTISIAAIWIMLRIARDLRRR